MAFALTTAALESSAGLTIADDPESGEPAIAEENGKRLAVARRGGDLILVRERTVGKLVKQADGSSKRDKSAGTEKQWHATPSLADIRDARAAGLFG